MLCKSEVVMPKKHHTLIWISESRVQKYSSKLPKFPIGRGEYIYVIYQVGGSCEGKKTVPKVLTVAKRARVVLKTTVFFPRQTNLDWLIGYLFIVIVSSALLQMTQKIFHTLVCIVKSWTSYGCPISWSDSMMYDSGDEMFQKKKDLLCVWDLFAPIF